MPEQVIDSSWEETFLSAVTAWNLYGLPLLLAALAALGWFKVAGAGGRVQTVRRAGLIHFGLAAWSVVWLVGEIRSYAGQGGPANPWVTGLPWVAIGAAVDVAVGLALRRVWRGAWLSAAALALWRTALGVLFVFVGWRNGVAVDWTEWPRLAVGYALPPFLAVLMLLPASVRAARKTEDETASNPDRAAGLLVLVWLGVVVSVVAVDALDLAVRWSTEVSDV